MPALGALFVLGFTGPFLDMTGHLALCAIGLAIVITTLVALGRFARSGRTALTTSLPLGPLAWLAVGYGIYYARETGWYGLTPLGVSSDHPGIGTIWFVLIAAAPVWFALSIGAAILAKWSNSRAHPVPKPVPPPTAL